MNYMRINGEKNLETLGQFLTIIFLLQILF